MKREYVPEVAIGRAVVAWLEADGWDVWQEVGVSSGGGVCDIVAKRGPVIHAIECKAAANTDVLEQAQWWVHRAHFTSVAVPRPKRNRLYGSFAKHLGIGVIWVEDGWHNYGEKGLTVGLWEQGPMARPREDKYRRPLSYFLTDERKHWPAEAGNNQGHRYTPFRETCEYLKKVVREMPGITMRQAVERMRGHHYSDDKAARAALMQWVRLKRIPGIRYEYRDGVRAACLYLEDSSC